MWSNETLRNILKMHKYTSKYLVLLTYKNKKQYVVTLLL